MSPHQTHTPQPASQPHPHPWADRLATIAFPITLWLIATLGLRGDLGLWLDDWLFIQRVPETGALRALALDTPVHYWRPLQKLIVPPFLTLLSDHLPLAHAILAALHAANAWLLYRIARRLGIAPWPASAAALVFMCWHGHMEVVFWLCALGTSLSCALTLAATLALIRRPDVPIALAALIAGSTAFIAASLNEQPAAIMLAAPVALWAIGARRSLILAVACAVALALALYIMGHAAFARGAPSVSGQGFLTPPRSWPTVALHTLEWAWQWGASVDIVARMLQLARAAVAATDSWGQAIWLAALAIATPIAAARWVARHARSPIHPRPSQCAPRPRHVAILGLALAASTLTPIVVTSYWLNPRILYAPAIGLALAIAAFLHVLARSRRPSPRPPRIAVVAASAVLLFFMSAAMIGVQEAFRQRWAMDQRTLADLRALAPHLPNAAVLIPAVVHPPRLSPPPTSTKAAAWFDARFWGITQAWWSAGPAIRLALARSDLNAAHHLRGWAWRRPSLIDDPIPGGSVVAQGVGRVAWSRVLAFEVGPQGRVRLIRRAHWTSPTGIEQVIDLPFTVPAALSFAPAEDPPAVFRFDPPDRHPNPPHEASPVPPPPTPSR